MNTLINKITASLPLFKKNGKKEKDGDNKAVIIKKIQPKDKNLVGRVLSFSISDRSVQMATAQHFAGKVKLLNVKTFQFSENLKDNDLEIEIQNNISDYISEHKSAFTKLILTVPGHDITFRNFIMPNLKDSELKSAVAYEADKLVPYSLEEAFYDYRKTFLIESNSNLKVKLTLHAAHKKIIEEKKKYFDRLRKPLYRIYHSQDTLGRLLGHIDNFSDDKKYILMNIGLNQTEISFYQGTVLEFSHSAFINAESMGIKSDSPNYEYFAEAIINEIQNSIDYSGQFTVSRDTSIYVYGDFADNERLYSLLNKITSFNIQPFPIDNIKFFNKFDTDTKNNILIGLSPIASALNKQNLADLLPPEEKQVIKLYRTNNYLKTIAASIFLYAFISWSFLNSKINNETIELNNLRTEVNTFVNSDVYHTYNSLKREILFDQKFMNQVKKEPSFLAIHLKELSNITSSSIKLLSLEYNPASEDFNFYLQGVVNSSEIPPEIILAEFIETLKDSPLYDEVIIVKHIKKLNKESGMDVEFTLKMEGLS